MVPGTGQLDWTAFERALGPRTRLVAVGAASNALGTITDVARASELARAAGALSFVDAVWEVFGPLLKEDSPSTGTPLACYGHEQTSISHRVCARSIAQRVQGIGRNLEVLIRSQFYFHRDWLSELSPRR